MQEYPLSHHGRPAPNFAFLLLLGTLLRVEVFKSHRPHFFDSSFRLIRERKGCAKRAPISPLQFLPYSLEGKISKWSGSSGPRSWLGGNEIDFTTRVLGKWLRDPSQPFFSSLMQDFYPGFWLPTQISRRKKGGKRSFKVETRVLL